MAKNILHICTKLAFINVDENADESSEEEVAATSHNQMYPSSNYFYTILFEFYSILIY